MMRLRATASLFVGLSCLALMPPAGLPSPSTEAPTIELAPELEPLRPLLGSWVGHFDDPGETAEILETWNEVLDGHAVRGVRRVPDAGDFEAETLYYFDREAGTISYVLVTNNGYVTRGTVAREGDRWVVDGRQIAPDSSVRDTHGGYVLRDDGTLVNEGGHTIVFERR